MVLYAFDEVPNLFFDPTTEQTERTLGAYYDPGGNNPMRNDNFDQRLETDRNTTDFRSQQDS